MWVKTLLDSLVATMPKSAILGLSLIHIYEFWPDDLTLLDSRRVDSTRLLDSSQVTDTYLLALAVAHGGKLATFDRHLVADAVVDGSKALCILG